MQGRQGGREAGLGLSRWVGLDKRKPGFLLPKRGRPASSLMLVLMMGRFAVGSRGRCPDTLVRFPCALSEAQSLRGPPRPAEALTLVPSQTVTCCVLSHPGSSWPAVLAYLCIQDTLRNAVTTLCTVV